MTDFEKWRTCSFEEYLAGKENPIDPADMDKDTPYLWMVSFGDGHGQQPGRLRNRQSFEPGIHRLGFITFDGSWHRGEKRVFGRNYDDSNRQAGYFFNGLFEMRRDEKSSIYFPVPGSSLQTRVEEGYFKEDPDSPSLGTENTGPDDGIARTPEEMRELIGNIGEPAHV